MKYGAGAYLPAYTYVPNLRRVTAGRNYMYVRPESGRKVVGGEEEGGDVKYWLHRFQLLLPSVKHGDIWRQIDRGAACRVAWPAVRAKINTLPRAAK